jgi:hypothetical protein
MKTGKPPIVLLLAVVLGLTLGGMARAESAEDYFERGLEAEKKGKLDQAITDFTKALELNPRDTAAYNKRGMHIPLKVSLIRPSLILTRPWNSTPGMPRPITTVQMLIPKKLSMTKPLPTTPRLWNSTPGIPMPTITVGMLT